MPNTWEEGDLPSLAISLAKLGEHQPTRDRRKTTSVNRAIGTPLKTNSPLSRERCVTPTERSGSSGCNWLGTTFLAPSLVNPLRGLRFHILFILINFGDSQYEIDI